MYISNKKLVELLETVLGNQALLKKRKTEESNMEKDTNE
jgi:hypothetical protein